MAAVGLGNCRVNADAVLRKPKFLCAWFFFSMKNPAVVGVLCTDQQGHNLGCKEPFFPSRTSPPLLLSPLVLQQMWLRTIFNTTWQFIDGVYRLADRVMRNPGP